MKKIVSLFLIAFLFTFIGKLNAQSNDTIKTKHQFSDEPNLQKGKSRLSINNLAFGFSSNSYNGSIGLAYGYFFMKNNLLELGVSFSFPQNDFTQTLIGLYYSHYFSPWRVKPFVLGGGGVGFATEDNDNVTFAHFTAGSGASIQVKRFGFQGGIQLDYNDYNNGDFSVKPLFGVSFNF